MGSFYSFLNWEGADIRSQIRPRKIPAFVKLSLYYNTFIPVKFGEIPPNDCYMMSNEAIVDQWMLLKQRNSNITLIYQMGCLLKCFHIDWQIVQTICIYSDQMFLGFIFVH